MIDLIDSLLRSKEAIYFVCAANRRADKGSSAQLATIGLDASYIRNAVQTSTDHIIHVLANSKLPLANYILRFSSAWIVFDSILLGLEQRHL